MNKFLSSFVGGFVGFALTYFIGTNVFDLGMATVAVQALVLVGGSAIGIIVFLAISAIKAVKL